LGGAEKRDSEKAMKIYMLLMLMSVFVCVSYYPARRQAEVRHPARHDSPAP
jgi:hypothetical protein